MSSGRIRMYVTLINYFCSQELVKRQSVPKMCKYYLLLYHSYSLQYKKNETKKKQKSGWLKIELLIIYPIINYCYIFTSYYLLLMPMYLAILRGMIVTYVCV